MFPTIEHIDQVLPAVTGRKDFVVSRKSGGEHGSGYVTIDYVFEEPETFLDPIRRECRGIKFCGTTGRILARPLNKFHNLAGHATTQPHLVDFSRPHTVMTKADGSLIHPMLVDNRIVFCTRMGRTDVAMKAEARHLTPHLAEHLRHLLEDGLTPCMEWVAQENRIVIKYEKSELILLAARHTISGEYLHWHRVDSIGAHIGLRTIEAHEPWTKSAHDFLDFVRPLLGTEGFVVRFDDGSAVKIKCEDYVLKHSSKEATRLEKNVLALIVTNGLDDVLPLLSPEDVERVERYRNDVLDGILHTTRRIEEIVTSGSHLDQKTFAVEHMQDLSPAIRALCFSHRKGKPARDVVLETIKDHCGSQTDVDIARGLFGGTKFDG